MITISINQDSSNNGPVKYFYTVAIDRQVVETGQIIKPEPGNWRELVEDLLDVSQQQRAKAPWPYRK